MGVVVADGLFLALMAFDLYLDDDAMMVDLGVIVHVASRVYPAFDYGEFAGNCGPLNSFWYDHWAAVRLLGAAEPRE